MKARPRKKATKPSAKPKKTASAKARAGGDAAIVASLQALATTLGRMAYQASEDSGDGAYYASEGLGGRTQLWKDYWHNVYQTLFFSAFYALDESQRAKPAIRACAKSAFTLYKRALADKAACDRAYREHVGPSARIAALRLFDGAREQPIVTLPVSDITTRLKTDGFTFPE